MTTARPEWAQAAIIARYEEDCSDMMTDYFGSKTTKLIVLAWSKHTRDLFPEMRKAADLLPETQYLGTGKGEYRIIKKEQEARDSRRFNDELYPTFEAAEAAAQVFAAQDIANRAKLVQGEIAAFSPNFPYGYEISGSDKAIEHREKYSMGSGYYLKGFYRSGWVVEKVDLRGGYNDKKINDAIAAGNHVFDGNRPTCLQEVEAIEEVAAVEPVNNVIQFPVRAAVEAAPNYVVITDAPVIEPVIITAKKHQPVKVELVRGEGLCDECVQITIEQVGGTGDVVAQANQILRFWALTAPEYGYAKCSFLVAYDDGETYQGRYDLTRADVTGASLKTHIEGYAEHVNDPGFASIPAYKEAKAYLTQFLNQYHIG